MSECFLKIMAVFSKQLDEICVSDSCAIFVHNFWFMFVLIVSSGSHLEPSGTRVHTSVFVIKLKLPTTLGSSSHVRSTVRAPHVVCLCKSDV